MFSIKTKEEIQIMAEGGKIAGEAIKEAIKHCKVGVTLREIDTIIDQFIVSKGGSASFRGEDGYEFASCINVNEGIVHGLPNEYKLKQGDLVSVDLGVLLKGFHTDISYSFQLESDVEHKFLETGKQALIAGIAQCRVGNKIGDIGHAIQSVVEKQKYSVSRDLVGHGVGRELHEDPLVPGYGKPGKGPVLRNGMVIAVEVIYQKGKPWIVLDEDGWTIRTADRSLSGLFEQTVAITSEGPLILTPF